jgi:hypothetical protein
VSGIFPSAQRGLPAEREHGPSSDVPRHFIPTVQYRPNRRYQIPEKGTLKPLEKKYDPVTGKIVFKKKVGYDSYNEAVMAVKKVKKDQPWDKVNWGIYVCPKCGKYHIGHQHLGNNPKPIVEADIKPEELLLHVG